MVRATTAKVVFFRTIYFCPTKASRPTRNDTPNVVIFAFFFSQWNLLGMRLILHRNFCTFFVFHFFFFSQKPGFREGEVGLPSNESRACVGTESDATPIEACLIPWRMRPIIELHPTYSEAFISLGKVYTIAQTQNWKVQLDEQCHGLGYLFIF